MALSNAELWNQLRKADATFESHTSEVTAEYFNENTFMALKRENIEALDMFFELPIRTALQQVNISHARDILENFGESYETPFGGNIQRIATASILPINPQYKNLIDRQWVNQYVIRKPPVSDRYFTQNFDYQSLLTLTYDYHYKQIFLSPFGMDEFVAGLMQGLENGWIIQKFLNKKAAINAALNSTVYPLKESQQISVPWTTGTDEEIKNFLLSVMLVISDMTVTAQTDKYSAYNFKSVQDRSRLRLLVRKGYKALLNVNTLVGAFNPQYLNLDIPIIEVDDFGGVEYYIDEALTTRIYPVYDATLGDVIGWTETEGGTEATYPTTAESTFYQKDPNADVVAILADKGWLFETVQNGYEVRVAENVAGLYRNFWASAPNNGIHIDPLYNVAVFRSATE